jgi:predicted nucleic acid-binding protein
MTIYTLDASVHINALNAQEAGSKASQAFLERVEHENLEMVCPSLLIPEMAAALARAFDNNEKSLALALAIQHLPNLTLVSLDEPLAASAAEMAALYRLRGADAVYAAVAKLHQATLVTMDHQQLERLTGVLPVMQPAQALAEK